MTIYTEEIHVKGLKIILTSAEPCELCPAFEVAKRLYPKEPRPKTIWANDECLVCETFISKYLELEQPDEPGCPCKQYGQADAIIKTKIVFRRFFPEAWKEIKETPEEV